MGKTNMLKIGDTVRWRGSFGMDAAKDAVVVGICKGAYNGDKDGAEIDEVAWNKLHDSRLYLVNLENGHWAWASQISRK